MTTWLPSRDGCVASITHDARVTLADIISNRWFDMDPGINRWLIRLLLREGTDLSTVGGDEIPRGTPVYAEASADAIELQRAMARNHVWSLFVITSEEALATVSILDFALRVDDLMQAARDPDDVEPMPDTPIRAMKVIPIGDDSAVLVYDYGYGFTIRCSGWLGITAADELTAALEHCLERRPVFIHVDCRTIEWLTSAGIEALLHVARRCHNARVTHQLSLNVDGGRLLHFVPASELGDIRVEDSAWGDEIRS
jgi:hypothetical protein